ncbi:MAG TPA: CHAT domain-containing protein [Thermoanaerobaculia bacterium]|nr:CHAT domain-containing protein [Thermoanaerobaculia bacterium]
MTNCPDAETLAAFAEGRLPRAEAAKVIAHLDQCDDCMATVEALNETIATRNVVPMRSRRMWWLAAAAGVAIAVVALFVVRQQRSPMSQLIALAPTIARPVEARLSVDFPWASYRGPMRADERGTDPRRMKLIGAAGDIVTAADRDKSAEAQKAAGIALLVIDEPLPAIERLRAAVQVSPNDASAWSDLAAAQYSTALRTSRPSLLPEALVSADRVLRIDARNAQARFNRALILEHLGLLQEARAQWQRYLEVDSTSAWAVEARERLKKLESPPAASSAQRLRTFTEGMTLAQWAEAFKRGDSAAAKQELDTAREAGESLARTSGESLLRDAVRAIDESKSADTFAEAHLIYRRGRIAYSKRQLDPALADLTRAATLFGNSPMSLVARYYAASVRFDRNDIDAARSELQQLLHDADAHPQYIALGAQVRWELALPMMVDADWSGALPLLERSRSAFAKLDERNHLGFIESLLADTLLSLGRLDEASAARSRAFTLLSNDGEGDRMAVSMTAAALFEIRAGRLAVARALLDVATGTSAHDPGVAFDVFVHSALVNVALDDSAEATRTLREATAMIERIADPATREIARTHLALAGAAVVMKSDPARAKELLANAIDGYRATDRTLFMPECYLLRARAELRSGDRNAAADDLDRGIELLERSRIRTGAVVGTGVLNAGVALFQDAIRLSAERGDVERTFAYAERSRVQLNAPRIGLRELQQSLANSDSAVLEVVALPEKIVAICVTGRDAAMEMRPLRREDETALYDAMIRPFDTMLASSRQLIVVADSSLQQVPFAALYDTATKRYLVERLAVSTAMSASALQPIQRSASGSLLAVALPSGTSNAGLPESAREIADVSGLYPSAVTIAPEHATFAAFTDAAPAANVIHIAGHTRQQSDDAGTALLFADDRVTWTSIALRHLPRAPVVVLAACETLRVHAAPNVRSMTLGDGFLAAGATDVIGTLTPIADADAHDLFQSIHRHLAAGDAPAQAVRAAQLEALSRHSEAWRSIASLTRCINTNVKRS